MIEVFPKHPLLRTFFVYDVALVKIDNPGSHPIICLPGPNILHSIKDINMNQEITIVGLGKRNKDDKTLWKRKLQHAKVTQVDELTCFKHTFAEKKEPKIPKVFWKLENRVFCVLGDKKKKILLCKGDSGSPAIWKHSNEKDYVIGIAAYQVNTGDCQIYPKQGPRGQKLQKIYVAIPGVIFKWIKEKGGKEIEDWIQKC